MHRVRDNRGITRLEKNRRLLNNWRNRRRAPYPPCLFCPIRKIRQAVRLLRQDYQVLHLPSGRLAISVNKKCQRQIPDHAWNVILPRVAVVIIHKIKLLAISSRLLLIIENKSLRLLGRSRHFYWMELTLRRRRTISPGAPGRSPALPDAAHVFYTTGGTPRHLGYCSYRADFVASIFGTHHIFPLDLNFCCASYHGVH